MKQYDVIILGGGASGLMCAITANPRLKIAICDKADRLGKKILATGNGRCNITNDNIDAKFYNTSLVAKYFKKYSGVDAIKDFANMGLITYSDNEGRRYPTSNSANSVLDIMLNKLNSMENVDVYTEADIQIVNACDNSFEVKANNELITSNKLVVAVGSNCDDMLINLGVKYNKFVPSLVSLKTDKNKGLAGVRVSNVEVTYNGYRERGEVLFKEDGISGIVIFNISSLFARNNLQNGEIIIDLLPDITKSDLINFITTQIQSDKPIELIIEGLLHKALAKNIVDRLKLKSVNGLKLTKNNINAIVNLIKSYNLIVTGLSNNNQVYSGGVSLSNLDDYLQYKDISGLYFAGEVVDVDGVCGGYNLQWAWTSGKIVGDAL